MQDTSGQKPPAPVFAIGRRAAWAFAVAFMAMLWTPALWEQLVPLRSGKWGATPAAKLLSWRPSHGPFIARLDDAGKALEDSPIATALRRTVQEWLTREAGQGNREVHIGYNDALFYRPDIEALTGRGPLAPEPIANTRDHGPAITPGARGAVPRFAAQLREFGIPLLIVPVPLKPMIYPELVTANTSHDWMTHPDAAAFYNELRAKGIDVLDLTPDLARLRNRRRHVYVRIPDPKDKAAVAQAEAEAREPTEAFLGQDTHWTPEAMQFSAEKISDHVKKNYPGVLRPRFKEIKAVDSIQRRSTGDLVKLLDLRDPAQSFPPEPVLLKVIGEGTEDRDSPIALLGDSFVNVFDDPALGFENPAKPGERIRAGFAQTLALRLQQPLDVIAINGEGATGVRRILAARAGDELRAKKLVIWVITARDLLLSGRAARDANIEWADVMFNPHGAAAP